MKVMFTVSKKKLRQRRRELRLGMAVAAQPVQVRVLRERICGVSHGNKSAASHTLKPQ